MRQVLKATGRIEIAGENRCQHFPQHPTSGGEPLFGHPDSAEAWLAPERRSPRGHFLQEAWKRTLGPVSERPNEITDSSSNP